MSGKVLFIGSKDLGLAALKVLVDIKNIEIEKIVTYNDRSDGRTKISEFIEFSKFMCIPLVILNKPSHLKEVVEDSHPDVCLVVGWYWMIDKSVLKIPEKGFVGLHASLLPQYRGASPLVWPIIRGEKKSGISLFIFDSGMDTGDLLFQKAFKITFNDTIGSVILKAEKLMLDALKIAFPAYVDGLLKPISQSDINVSYASQRIPTDGEIDWNKPAIDVYNFIRAQSLPYPGAFSHIDDETILRIWSVSLFPYLYYGVPGQIVQFVNNNAVICCGEGAIVAEDISIENYTKDTSQMILKYNQRLRKCK